MRQPWPLSIAGGYSANDRSPPAQASASSRHADASGVRPRRSTIRFISPAWVNPSSAATASSTTQNAGSSATEVAWPDRETERFFSPFTLQRTPTMMISASAGAPWVSTAWRVSVVNRSAPAESRISARTA